MGSGLGTAGDFLSPSAHGMGALVLLYHSSVYINHVNCERILGGRGIGSIVDLRRRHFGPFGGRPINQRAVMSVSILSSVVVLLWTQRGRCQRPHGVLHVPGNWPNFGD